MPETIAPALRVLGYFWLEEVQADDMETLVALPELARTLPESDHTFLDTLAVEYQRLFGFNLPPYESVFMDPSAMLMAPATERVQHLYRQGVWQPPANLRTGAPDHLGVELLALADWLETEQAAAAYQLYTQHLALWIPLFVLTLQRLSPHQFYQTLADLTLGLVLTTLPDTSSFVPEQLFPILPPPPVFRGSDDMSPSIHLRHREEGETVALRDVVNRFLPARDVGLFLTREDIARIGQDLDLPSTMGQRFQMLENLFRLAGQYDLIPALFDRLEQLISEAELAYQELAEIYPNWRPYAQAWRRRMRTARTQFGQLTATLAAEL